MDRAAGRGPVSVPEFPLPPAAWIPHRVRWEGDEPSVEWCYLGECRFVDPFFDDTVRKSRCVAPRGTPRPRTPLAVLQQQSERADALPVAGLIFHMSRCGSTLLAALLREAAGTVVLAEPDPIDDVLRANLHAPGITDVERVGWVQAVARVLGQRRDPADRRVVLKLDCWSIFHLPLLRQAFPQAPWVFLYRDPLEVLVSHARMAGRQLVPELVEPQVFGLPEPFESGMAFDEYGARVLAAILAEADRHAGGGMLLNYDELPGAAAPVARSFGIPVDDLLASRVVETAQCNAKLPTEPFQDDRAEKRQQATARVRHLAATWIAPAYERLEARRREQLARYAAASTAAVPLDSDRIAGDNS